MLCLEQWIKECCTEKLGRGLSQSLPFKEARLNYLVWCEQRNEVPLGAKQFSQALVAAGFRRYLRHGVTRFAGLRLLKEEKNEAG